MRILGGGRNPHRCAEMGTLTGQMLLRALVAGRVHCYCRLTIRSPMQITSSIMLRLPITVQYACMEAGIEDRSVVMPSSIQNIRSCSEGSDVVAT